MQNSSKFRLWLIIGTIATGICLIAILLPNFFVSNYNPPPTITSLPQVTVIPSVSLTPVSLPPFPWPMPQYSALEVLTLGSLGQLAGTGVTFHDVDERISSALDAAGYDEISYFGVPNGFAIVTRLEKMDANGYPDYPNRWASSLKPISVLQFSLTEYLEALFSAPKGHYRVLVFVVSSETVIQSGTAVAQGTAEAWVVQGANKLPSNMEPLQYTLDHTTTVYIYEFIQSGIGTEATYNIPSDFTGKQHLERAGLWENLNADTSTPLIEIFPQVDGGKEFVYFNNDGVLNNNFLPNQECIHSGVYGLQLSYNMGGAGIGIWGVQWSTSVLHHFNASSYNALAFWVKGASGGETFQIGLKDTTGNNGKGYEVKIESRDFLIVAQHWSEVIIPFTEFAGVNTATIGNVNFFFNKNHRKGSICIDDIAFVNQ